MKDIKLYDDINSLIFDGFNDNFFAKTINSLFNDNMQAYNMLYMKTDIQELNDKYIFTIDIPGFDKNNINIKLKNSFMIVHAENKIIEDNKKYIKKERINSYTRKYYIGDKIDENNIKASYKNGILEIILKKKNVEINECKNINI